MVVRSLGSDWLNVFSGVCAQVIFVQEALSKLSPVAYVDILDGDAEGHVRFHAPEEAKAVSDARAQLQKEHSWKLEILSGVVSPPPPAAPRGSFVFCE